MKVYLVLQYEDENCKVIRVHTTREAANKCALRNTKRNPNCTYHVCTKKIKGKFIVPVEKVTFILSEQKLNIKSTLNQVLSEVTQ